MARIDDLLRLMRSQGASDLHLTSGSAPFMRIDGEMVKQNYKAVSAETCQSLIFEILTESQKELFENHLDLDFSYPLKNVGRFRVNVFMQRHGVAACLDRKSTRLNSSHSQISYAVFCLKKKKN